ncbi:MAG: glycosyltransferase involved in cell wall biosynthesis [bacterium]|jgi:glycosyltransferase involved in cell wall biosynthesis
MKVAIVEPFYAGSHKTWVDELSKFASFESILFTLPGRHWKWRMGAGAIQLAKKVNESNDQIDIFLVTDMLDVALFKSLLSPKYQSAKIVLYMHENQVVYPFQTPYSDKNKDRHYGLINYKSILVADHIWFNSQFHINVFYAELATFLAPFPEAKFHQSEAQRGLTKSSVMPIGIDCDALDKSTEVKSLKPTILWNHRWEYDKNPDLFFQTLIKLSQDGLDFDLCVLGEHYSNIPPIFETAFEQLKAHIIHWGFVKDKKEYYRLINKSTILPVTSNQEFYGLSVMEAIYCGVTPILPNRLSYSDLYQSLDCFYYTDDTFYTKLKTAIVNDDRRNYKSHVSRFNWKEVVKQYEETLLIIVV